MNIWPLRNPVLELETTENGVRVTVVYGIMDNGNYGAECGICEQRFSNPDLDGLLEVFAKHKEVTHP